MNKEKAIERLKEDVKYADLRDTVDGDCTICYIEDIETVLNYIKDLEKNSMPKQVILDKIEELEELESELSDEEGYWGNSEILYKLDILREILEGENNENI